jgi:hypothetical protein
VPMLIAAALMELPFRKVAPTMVISELPAAGRLIALAALLLKSKISPSIVKFEIALELDSRL